MECRLCKGSHISIIYDGKIRNGGLGQYTRQDMPIYQCEDCGVIWHEKEDMNLEQYYESTQYRESLEGNSDIEEFYRLHDKETMAKFAYTGAERFRHKTVADIGCGGGAFLDFLSGVAKDIIAVEPSAYYRSIMEQKGYHTYPYATEAAEEWKGKVDTVVSFDVIEHVEDPIQFLNDIKELLSENGEAVIGTPTDAPVMRQMLGNIYEQRLLFSTQHLWIFSEKNLEMMAKAAGFRKFKVRYFQRYGLSNFIGWIKEQHACGERDYSFVSETMDAVWKSEISRQGISDYIVMYLSK